MTYERSDVDHPPPDNVPHLEWGDALPLVWDSRDEGALVRAPNRFKTTHRSSVVVWNTLDSLRCQPEAGYHVPYPDGTPGYVVRQTSGMGMVNMNARPWRRMIVGTKTWWPGQLVVTRDRVSWTDADELLPLWQPNDWQRKHTEQAEIGPDELPKNQFYWLDLYSDLSTTEGFLESVRHDDFASSVFDFLRDHEVVRVSDEKTMLVRSDRRYGDMLGAWRRCGESYLDWYPKTIGRPRPTDDATIEDFLSQAGYLAVSW